MHQARRNYSQLQRGRGDNMGIAGKLNDNADIPAPARTTPNGFGLYNMAGNAPNVWMFIVH